MKIYGETHYLWRAVDHEGEFQEAFVSKRRDREAALVEWQKIYAASVRQNFGKLRRVCICLTAPQNALRQLSCG